MMARSARTAAARGVGAVAPGLQRARAIEQAAAAATSIASVTCAAAQSIASAIARGSRQYAARPERAHRVEVQLQLDGVVALARAARRPPAPARRAAAPPASPTARPSACASACSAAPPRPGRAIRAAPRRRPARRPRPSAGGGASARRRRRRRAPRAARDRPPPAAPITSPIACTAAGTPSWNVRRWTSAARRFVAAELALGGLDGRGRHQHERHVLERLPGARARRRASRAAPSDPAPASPRCGCPPANRASTPRSCNIPISRLRWARIDSPCTIGIASASSSLPAAIGRTVWCANVRRAGSGVPFAK